MQGETLPKMLLVGRWKNISFFNQLILFQFDIIYKTFSFYNLFTNTIIFLNNAEIVKCIF